MFAASFLDGYVCVFCTFCLVIALLWKLLGAVGGRSGQRQAAGGLLNLIIKAFFGR